MASLTAGGARQRKAAETAMDDCSELTEAFKMRHNQVLQRMRADGLSLLAVSRSGPIANKLARQLIRKRKELDQGRYITAGLPPLLVTADALAFIPHVDATLMAVEELAGSIQDLESMTELLTPFNLIGTVMSRPAPN